MNIKACVISVLVLPLAAYAGVSFSGSALLDAPDVEVGDFGVLLVDTTGVGFNSISIYADDSLVEGATYGDLFAIINGSGASAASQFSSIAFNGAASFDLVDGITQGDQFGLLVFSSSTSTALVGDIFRVWTDASWLVPADGSFSFGSNLSTLSSAASYTGTVSAVPEPSTYAVLAGLVCLGYVIVSRRRTSV